MGKKGDWKVTGSAGGSVFHGTNSYRVENRETGEKRTVTVNRDFWGEHEMSQVGEKIEKGKFDD